MADKSLPEKLKPVAHYIKIANEHSNRDPAVYYWCLFYAADLAMKLDRTSPEAKQYLSNLLAVLEQVKKKLAEQEAVANEVVAQAHLEEVALKVFVWADSQDRAGIFNKNVVKAFYTSGHLFDVLSLFGEIDEKIEEHRKYAKWKAAYIHNCLKNGETPVAGPLGEGGESELGGDTATHPATSGGEITVPVLSVPPAAAGMVDIPGVVVQPAAAGESGPSSGSKLSAEDLVNAQKFCKFAGSALTYEDIPTAVDYLKKALKLLQPGDAPY